MNQIQHGKQITTESYYEGQVASTKYEVEVSTFSDKDHILRDVIESFKVISSGESKKLEMCVQIDSQGRYRLIAKWVV